MERYLEGEEIAHDEIVTALKDGTNHGDIFPVTCGVATRNLATNRLLDAIVEDLPSPVKHGAMELPEITLEPDEDKALFAYVFKTKADPFAGRINFFRVYQGVMKSDSHVLNTRAHGKERIGHLDDDDIGPGDMGAVAKLKETSAGDWLADRDEPISMPPIKLPAPVMAFAMTPKSKGDEDKVVHRAAPPAGGGPDDRPAPRPADRRADHRRPVADARRGRRRADARPVRRRGRPQAAARALPGDDPQAGQGPRAPQEAERRARPVRRLPHRDRAARARRGLRVRRRDQGRRDPQLVHPGGREGRARGDAAGPDRRLPDQGRARPRCQTASTTPSTRPSRRSARPGRWRCRRRWPAPARCCSSRSCS